MPLIQAERLTDTWSAAEPSSLYIHIPFCRNRCFYCDFTTYVAPKPEVEAYIVSLERELEMLGTETKASLKTVFVGGGTPTYLTTSQLDRVFQALHRNFRLEHNAEVTVEANPGTVSKDKLQLLQTAGVNRLSFGAQTFDDNLLMAIGRSHDASTVIESVELAQQCGIDRVSLDLMFGLPDQTLNSVRRAVKQCIALGIDHISAYWLKVEQGTPFAKWQDQGYLPLPGEDAEADMYELVQTLLGEAGLEQYEVSNFARPGEEARHNLVYWRNQPYLAAGVSAHAYVHGNRYENVTSLLDYALQIRGGQRPLQDQYPVSAAEAAENTMMLGLRLAAGVNVDDFELRHGVACDTLFHSQLQRLQEMGVLILDGRRIRVLPHAYAVANVVFEAFVGALTD